MNGILSAATEHRFESTAGVSSIMVSAGGRDYEIDSVGPVGPKMPIEINDEVFRVRVLRRQALPLRDP